jgi:hypothetical protein
LGANPLEESTLPEPVRLTQIHAARKTHSGLNWRHRHIDDFNGLDAKFRDCDFSYSVFTRAYLRNAEFVNCRLTGCRFIDSNFKGATFSSTSIDFALFQRCLVDIKEILAVLPPEPNKRQENLQNLIANTQETGTYNDQRLIVQEKIKTNKLHQWYALVSHTEYYSKKYATIWNKLEVIGNLISLHTNGFLWGNGERPSLILFSALLFLAILTAINAVIGLQTIPWSETENGIKFLKYSVSFLFGIPVELKFGGVFWIDFLLAAMRYVYVGLFISVLYRSISHR